MSKTIYCLGCGFRPNDLGEYIVASEDYSCTPEEYVNSVVGYICSRRGKILNIEIKGAQRMIAAEVPLSEMFGYATAFRSLSSGRANASMEFDKYQQVPKEIALKIIEEKKAKEKEKQEKG